MAQMDLVNFAGTAEECEAIRQFARDFVWDLRRGEKLEDPAFAVDQAVADIVAAIDGEPNPEAVERLRGELPEIFVSIGGNGLIPGKPWPTKT